MVGNERGKCSTWVRTRCRGPLILDRKRAGFAVERSQAEATLICWALAPNQVSSGLPASQPVERPGRKRRCIDDEQGNTDAPDQRFRFAKP